MVRPLSKELQKIAVEELNENPERLEEDIQHIQEWIKQQPHLNAPTDKQWVLSFLRGSKFSLQRTKEKLDYFYTLKSIIPEILLIRDIYSTEMQAILKAGVVLPLPYTENHQGPRIILVRFQNLNKDITNVENLTAFFYMILSILVVEDDNSIVAGVLFWLDLSHFPYGFIFQLTPIYLKHCLQLLQNASLLRVKGVHGSGSPSVAEKIVLLMKGYLKPKLKNRIFIYSENNFKNIHQSIPKSYMPKEYGGENSTLEEITDYWIENVESHSTLFAEMNQHITNEAMRPEKSALFDEFIGMDGSFRKLNLD